jgi:hypothetical protein
MLAGMEKNPGTRNEPGGNSVLPPKLEDLGIDKTQSSRWQREARVAADAARHEA